MKRTKRRGLLRNVAVALGNWGSPEAVPVLVAALDDEEPLIRGHAAWALGRITTPDAFDALRVRARVETDAWVLQEAQQGLEACASASPPVRISRGTPGADSRSRIPNG